MQNKPNFRKSQMNVTIYSQMAYENKSNWTLGENKPNQTQFQRQKMLLRLTINGRRKSFGYYADEIEASKAYDRVDKKYRGTEGGDELKKQLIEGRVLFTTVRLFKIFDIPPSFSADK